MKISYIMILTASLLLSCGELGDSSMQGGGDPIPSVKPDTGYGATFILMHPRQGDAKINVHTEFILDIRTDTGLVSSEDMFLLLSETAQYIKLGGEGLILADYRGGSNSSMVLSLVWDSNKVMHGGSQDLEVRVPSTNEVLKFNFGSEENPHIEGM